MSPQQESDGSATHRIRDRLRHGAYAPGAPLPIAEFALQLGLSHTPIREALAHLAGEGLIVERRGAGYFVEGLDAQGLTELYDLHRLLVVEALRSRGRSGRSGVTAVAPEDDVSSLKTADPVVATEIFFAGLVEAAANRVLAEAHRRLADRLAPSRAQEPAVLGGADLGVSAMIDLAVNRDAAGLLQEIGRYHRRRVSAAAEIVVAVRSVHRV